MLYGYNNILEKITRFVIDQNGKVVLNFHQVLNFKFIRHGSIKTNKCTLYCMEKIANLIENFKVQQHVDTTKKSQCKIIFMQVNMYIITYRYNLTNQFINIDINFPGRIV